ncbi:hypothetical protein GQ55_3G138600 [Panicum hallii var. hallii]|nr:hypothetical protein GQ55_3G138600 [Panicum hallii var. hallii]
MDMEEHGHAEAPSSQSSTFPAASFSASPDEASSLVPGSSNLDTIPNLEEFIICQEARQEQARRRNGHARGAFMPYSRHLSTKKQPKPGAGAGAGGQRAIKAAMSALARMHKVRLAQWQRYQMEMALAAVAPPTGSNCGNQLQHVLSERKRREKLNDSFKALKTVLPPAPKKDKASILIRARDYVNTLKSRLSELEERNRTLVELQHQCDDGGERDDVSDEQIEVDINRAAAAEETSQVFHLKIVVRSGCNAMDAVVSILECLKELGDVRLADMDTGSRGTTLALQMKTSRCDDNFLKESVIKSVKCVMQSKIESLSFFYPSVEVGI